MNVHDRHFIHDTGNDDHDDIFHLLFNFSFITIVWLGCMTAPGTRQLYSVYSM